MPLCLSCEPEYFTLRKMPCQPVERNGSLCYNVAMTAVKKTRLAVWIQAVRAPFFSASLIPVCVGAALTLYYGTPAAWPFLPLVLMCAVTFHAATNIINDYYDHVKGVDTVRSLGSSKVIQQGLLQPSELRRAGLLLFALGALLSCAFLPLRGPVVLLFLACALLGGYLYTGSPLGYKYLALGDLFVFLLMGPLMVLGTYVILTDRWDGRVLAASLPVGLLVAAVLGANNLRDIEHDRAAGVRTLAGALGFQAAKRVYALLLVGAYLVVAVMIFNGTLPWLTASVCATFPLARRNLKTVRAARKTDARELATLDLATARLHLAFGLLYIFSILLGVFFA